CPRWPKSVETIQVINRKRLIILTASLLSIVIATVAGEVITRVTESIHPTFGKLRFVNSGEEFVFDQQLGWRNVPNLKFVTNGKPGSTNSQGFRSFEYPIERENSRKRVLVLGDSFTWGLGVANEDIFPRVAEKTLRTANINVDIINTGVSGWGNDQEYLYFVHEGFRYKPDIVVLAFFIINDPADNCN